MAYPSKDRSSMKHSGGKSHGDGYHKDAKTGGAHVPGGHKWASQGANVKESRLNSGSDKQWRGKR